MGKRYGGISMINESLPLLSGLIAFSNSAANSSATAAPNTYMPKMIKGEPAAKKAPAMVEYTGKRALQDIKGVNSTVFLRILGSSNPRAVSTAVAEQPNPISMVNALRPLKPILRNIPSVIKATRLI